MRLQSIIILISLYTHPPSHCFNSTNHLLQFAQAKDRHNCLYSKQAQPSLVPFYGANLPQCECIHHFTGYLQSNNEKSVTSVFAVTKLLVTSHVLTPDREGKYLSNNSYSLHKWLLSKSAKSCRNPRAEHSSFESCNQNKSPAVLNENIFDKRIRIKNVNFVTP